MSFVLVQGKGYVPLAKLDETKVEVWDGEMYSNANLTSVETDITQIEFDGGFTVKVPSQQKFKVVKAAVKSWVEAQNLKKGENILVNTDAPEFDFFAEFPLLSYSSFVLGALSAANILYREENSLKIPSTEFSLRDIIDKNVPEGMYSKHESHRANFVYKIYEFNSNALFLILDALVSQNTFAESVYTSKNFLRGFLQTFFNVATVKPKSLSVKVSRNFAQNLQQLLLLFGIRGRISKGLLKDTLYIKTLDLYNFAQRISILEPERLTKAFVNDNLESYRVMNTRPLTMKVLNVTMLNTIEYRTTVTDSASFKFMNDGLICYSDSTQGD